MEEKKLSPTVSGKELATTIKNMTLTLKCKHCRKDKPKIEFADDYSDIGNASITMKVCRPCMRELISKPVYANRALTNIMGAMIADNDYDIAKQLVINSINQALKDPIRSIGLIKEIMDRLDGPIKQKIEVSGDPNAPLVSKAEQLKEMIRTNTDDTT